MLSALSSLKLTIACLIGLMILVFVTTLSQVDMGIYAAKKAYFEGWFVMQSVGGFRLPIFPSGFFIGWLLVINLIVAHFYRFKWTWQKSGIWLTHVGLIVLIIGSGYVSMASHETQMTIEEGQTKNYVEDLRQSELAISLPKGNEETVIAFDQSALAAGKTLSNPEMPITLRIKAYFPNANLSMAKPDGAQPNPWVNRGIGMQIAVENAPEVTADDLRNLTSAVVEVLYQGQSLGTWLVSTGLGAAQSVSAGSQTIRLQMRPARYYLPYSLTLKDFRHDVYPGTTIPKNFSSLITLNNPQTHERRDVLIFMNTPLRYAGKTFYQASFGKGDTMTVLQVVENKGWLLPYVSSSLIALGLLVQFGLSLTRFLSRRRSS